MKTPILPANEQERLAALRKLKILDTDPEERFDRITRIAQKLFGVPIALISLVDKDRQWFKSCQGLGTSETSRDVSFCGHSILGSETMLVEDARSDPRFHDNPLVTGEPNIRFYAGHPLTLANQYRLGTLCLIDTRPRQLSPEELELLHDLAQIVEDELASIQIATQDELTGLSNRRGFEVLAEEVLSLCHRLQRHASLLFFDLDNFKEINDSYGHNEGDLALRRFSQSLQDCFRESDVIARLGGDEFVVLLTDNKRPDCKQFLQRLDRQLARYNQQGKYALDYSVGSMEFDLRKPSPLSAMIAEADRRMYQHKRSH